MSDTLPISSGRNNNITTLRIEISAEESNTNPVVFLKESFDELYQPVRLSDFDGQGKYALDANLRRFVELHLPSGEDSDEESIKEFINRARVNASLDHPNILPIHDMGVGNENLPFCVLRHVKGIPLTQWLMESGSGRKDLNSLLGIWENVCQAVMYAHSKNVAHTGVVPENIVVGDFGEVFLINWDLAQKIDDKSPGRLTRKDIQSLGRLLEVILESGTQTVVPLGLKGVCLQASSATGIYRTVEDAADDVRRFRDGYPTHAEEAGLLRQVLLFAKRHRKTALVTCIAISLLVTSGVLYAQTIRRETAHLSLLRQKAEARKREADLAALEADTMLQKRRSIAPVFAELGRSYLERGDIQGAKEHLIRGKILNDKVPEIYMVSGDLHQSQLQMKQAVTAYRMAAMLGKNSPLVDASISASQEFTANEGEADTDARTVELVKFMFRNSRPFEALRLANTCSCPQSVYNQIANSVLRNLNSGVTIMELGKETQLRNEGVNLKVAPVLGVLKKYNIKRFNFVSLKNMTGIYSLDGFEDMPLGALELPFTSLQDISACKSMNLKYANFSFCKVLDLSPLKGQPLQVLAVNGCPVNDLEPLRGAPVLSYGFNRTHIDDLEPISAGLRFNTDTPVWKTLSLRDTPVFDLRPLQGSLLQRLFLDGSKIDDISALKDVQVRELYLSGTRISDLRPLADQKELQVLVLTNCPNIRDLTPLRNVITLRELRIERTGVRDLTPIKDLPIRKLGFTPGRIKRGRQHLKSMPLEKVNTKASGWWVPPNWQDASGFLK